MQINIARHCRKLHWQLWSATVANVVTLVNSFRLFVKELQATIGKGITYQVEVIYVWKIAVTGTNYKEVR